MGEIQLVVLKKENMKTTLLTKENREQIVFTAETDFEKKMLEKFGKGQKEAKIFTGSFYDCQGGWTREGKDDESLIIVFDTPSNPKQIMNHPK